MILLTLIFSFMFFNLNNYLKIVKQDDLKQK